MRRGARGTEVPEEAEVGVVGGGPLRNVSVRGGRASREQRRMETQARRGDHKERSGSSLYALQRLFLD